MGIGGNELQDFVQLGRGRLVQRDAYATLELLGPELGIELAERHKLALHQPALPGGLVVGGMGAKADILGAGAIMDGRFDRPGVHAAIDRIQDEAAKGLEVGYHAIDQPGGAVAHLKDVHEYDGLHARIPCLDGGLDGIQAAGAAKNVRPGVHVHVNGTHKQFFRKLQRTSLW